MPSTHHVICSDRLWCLRYHASRHMSWWLFWLFLVSKIIYLFGYIFLHLKKISLVFWCIIRLEGKLTRFSGWLNCHINLVIFSKYEVNGMKHCNILNKMLCNYILHSSFTFLVTFYVHSWIIIVCLLMCKCHGLIGLPWFYTTHLHTSMNTQTCRPCFTQKNSLNLFYV